MSNQTTLSDRDVARLKEIFENVCNSYIPEGFNLILNNLIDQAQTVLSLEKSKQKQWCDDLENTFDVNSPFYERAQKRALFVFIGEKFRQDRQEEFMVGVIQAISRCKQPTWNNTNYTFIQGLWEGHSGKTWIFQRLVEYYLETGKKECIIYISHDIRVCELFVVDVAKSMKVDVNPEKKRMLVHNSNKLICTDSFEQIRGMNPTMIFMDDPFQIKEYDNLKLYVDLHIPVVHLSRKIRINLWPNLPSNREQGPNLERIQDQINKLKI